MTARTAATQPAVTSEPDRRRLSRWHGSTASRSGTPVLLLENIADTAVQALLAAGYDNVEQVAAFPDEQGLAEALREARVLGIRSRTQLDARLLESARDLLAIGCFSVGTNQVDLQSARIYGIPVFNAPFSNTRSVAELTIAEIVMLLRGVYPKSVAAHAGIWQKTAKASHEVRGKTLGIVGYGNIGSQLAMLAEAMGMRVRYFDQTDKLRHGNVEPTESLHELLGLADVVSLHLPASPSTRGIIGHDELRCMRKGAFLINNARGSLIDLEALALALADGHLGGAALDVFPEEPVSNAEPFDCPLQRLPNVVLTPHIAGSTEEAQERTGEEVVRKLVDYLDTGSTAGAVNFPQLQLPINSSATRIVQVHINVPGAAKRFNDVLARHEVNITAQHLGTDKEIGYMVVDVDGRIKRADDMMAEIRDIEGTIRVRMLRQPG